MGDLIAGISKSLLPLPIGMSKSPGKLFDPKLLGGFSIFKGDEDDLGGMRG